MRYRVTASILRSAVFLCLFLSFPARPSIAGEMLPATDIGEVFGQHREYQEGTPFHETEGFLSLGYRRFSVHDSEKASEYQDPHSSLAGNLDIASYQLPHRFHLATEYLSADNYYGDAGYALNDLLLIRDIFTAVYHKLDGNNYQYAGEAPAITYDNRTANDGYHVGVFDNFFSLRFKAPDFPFHTFLKHRYVAKDGLLQERFLIGYFGNITKVSQARQIDWQSNALTMGANSHLGPAEIEYSYEVTKFDPGRNNIFYDAYPATPTRPADTYPHDVIPETESSANSLKVHSSYTGGLVAAATLSTIAQKNNYSGAKSDSWQGATDLSYVPFPELNFFFKFRHLDQESNNPDSVTLRGLGNATSYVVRPAISSKNDVFSFSARYRPVQKLVLLSNYEFSHCERTNTDLWRILPDYTESNSIKLAAQASPFNSMKLKVSTDYRFAHNPALNSEPDYANQVNFSSTYLPAAWVMAFMSYNRSVTERDNVRYLNSDPNIAVDGGRRETKNGRLMASLSFLFSPKMTLTTSFARYNGKVEQNLAYGKWNNAGTGGDLPFLDPEVPYTDKANFYSLSLYYVPIDGIIIMTNISHTVSEGKFSPGLAEAQSPVSLAAFSEVKVAETAWAVELTKALQNKWEVGLQFVSNFYNDRFDDSQDGRFYTSTCILKRRF